MSSGDVGGTAVVDGLKHQPMQSALGVKQWSHGVCTGSPGERALKMGFVGNPLSSCVDIATGRAQVNSTEGDCGAGRGVCEDSRALKA